jgi:hypothetical protein
MTGRIIATGLLLTLAAQAQAAAAVPQELPPPGLYRVDSTIRKDEKVGPHEASTTFRADGASGDQASRSVVARQDGGARIDKGDAPLTQCIKAGAQALPPAFAAAACKTQPQCPRPGTGCRVPYRKIHAQNSPPGCHNLGIRDRDRHVGRGHAQSGWHSGNAAEGRERRRVGGRSRSRRPGTGRHAAPSSQPGARPWGGRGDDGASPGRRENPTGAGTRATSHRAHAWPSAGPDSRAHHAHPHCRTLHGALNHDEYHPSVPPRRAVPATGKWTPSE